MRRGGHLLVRAETISYVLLRRQDHETRRLPSTNVKRHQRGIDSVRTKCHHIHRHDVKLAEFHPKTKKAEQEFLSWYWRWNGDGQSIHKKNNFQLHQLYIANPEVPPGRDKLVRRSPSVDHPQKIRVHHFSADQKPSMILVNDMASVEGWLAMEDHLREHARYMMENNGERNPALHNQPKWKGKIEVFLREAYLEWFDAWRRTYVNVMNFVLETAYNEMVFTRADDGEC